MLTNEEIMREARKLAAEKYNDKIFGEVGPDYTDPYIEKALNETLSKMADDYVKSHPESDLMNYGTQLDSHVNAYKEFMGSLLALSAGDEDAFLAYQEVESQNIEKKINDYTKAIIIASITINLTRTFKKKRTAIDNILDSIFTAVGVETITKAMSEVKGLVRELERHKQQLEDYVSTLTKDSALKSNEINELKDELKNTKEELKKAKEDYNKLSDRSAIEKVWAMNLEYGFNKPHPRTHIIYGFTSIEEISLEKAKKILAAVDAGQRSIPSSIIYEKETEEGWEEEDLSYLFKE